MYSWLTFAQAKAELANRLNDPSSVFWGDAEKGLYLAMAMRMFNCLTAFWVAEQNSAVVLPAPSWYRSDGAGLPRARTLSDTDIYTQLQYMLLEPATGGTWTGTNQFNMPQFAQALQGRRDEVCQIGATDMVEIALPITPGTNRVMLPDNTLDVFRVRYVPAPNLTPPQAAATLQRGDGESFRVFTPSTVQTTAAPLRWDTTTGPPLGLTLDSNTPVPATLYVLTMQAEPSPAPPAATPLGLPDDWTWIVLFGAMFDLLSTQEESKDLQRAQYASQRYEKGLELIKNAPWLLEARINDIDVDSPSVLSRDRFNYEWQANPNAFPGVVTGGMDLYAISPTPTSTSSVTLVVVGNAPTPVNGNDEIQVPRDVMNALLDYAEHMALFKRGGPEFQQSMALYESFLGTADRWKSRYLGSGPFADTLRSMLPKSEEQQPRFAKEK